MTASEKDLTADEGVNQGSADGTTEDEETAGNTGALAAASQDGTGGGYDPVPPLDTETAESRGAREEAGPGQQQQVGEG